MSTGSLAQGELIAERYKVTRLIGSGGMGEVYEAYDLLLKEDVALKTLRSDLAHRDSVVQHFQKEIQLARKVTHPNVCRIFEVAVRPRDSIRPPLLFFAMELLKGDTLSSRIQVGKLTRAEAFPIIIQLAEGLEAAHRAGVVHSDFKSSNVILVPAQNGVRAVITDFGLARLDPSWVSSDETGTQTPDTRIAGTVAYMSPEQMTGGVVTAASDIYSFGIVLFEMATGSLPFHDRHLIQSAMQRGDSQSIAVRSSVPNIDPRWEAAISRCLQRDPKLRFESVGEIANWFREGAWQNPRYWTRREWIRNSAAAAVTFAAGTGGWIWWRRPYQPLPEALKWYRQGVDALHSMTYESARRALENAVKEDPGFALAHASLARAYDELDSADKANDSMMRAVTISKEIRLSSDDARKLEAMRLMVSRDYKHALPLFRQIEDNATALERPAAALESGWLSQQHEETDAAVAAYKRALKWDPNYAAAKLRMAFLFGRALKNEMALALFKEAEALYVAKTDSEGVTETLYQRASFLNRRNLVQEAMPVIEEALKVVHGADNAYQEIRLQLLKSVVSGKMQQTEVAIGLAKESINRADNENMDNLATGAFIDLGGIYFRAGDLESAEKYFEDGLKRARGKWPRNEARAKLLLGSLYEQEQLPQKAREFVEAALPFYRQAGYRRELVQASGISGYALSQLGEYQEGLKILEEALPSAKQLNDERVEAQLRERIAIALRDKGEWLKSLAEYERAGDCYKGSSGQGEVWVSSAGILWRLGRRTDAEHFLSRARQLATKSPTPRLLSLIRAHEAVIAYLENQWSECQSRIREPLPTGGSARDAEQDMNLLRALLIIHSGPVREGLMSATSLVEEREKLSLMGDAASARLMIAEALMVAGDRTFALKLAREALKFFSSKKISEAEFRGHAVAARASLETSDVDAHSEAARTALVQLNTIWTSADVARYRARPDIQKLSQGLQL